MSNYAKFHHNIGFKKLSQILKKLFVIYILIAFIYNFIYTYFIYIYNINIRIYKKFFLRFSQNRLSRDNAKIQKNKSASI